MHFFTSWHVSATFLERATIPVTSFPGCCHKTNFGSLPFLSGLYEINNEVKIDRHTSAYYSLYVKNYFIIFLLRTDVSQVLGFLQSCEPSVARSRITILWNQNTDSEKVKNSVLCNIHRALESFTK